MPTIPDPPEAAWCATCQGALRWLWSPRRQAWTAWLVIDRLTLRIHGCETAQDPATWRDIHQADRDAYRRGAARARQALTGEEAPTS